MFSSENRTLLADGNQHKLLFDLWLRLSSKTSATQTWRRWTVSCRSSTRRRRRWHRAAGSWMQVGFSRRVSGGTAVVVSKWVLLWACVQSLITELKELTSSPTTEEVITEIQQLKDECSGFRTRLEKIKSATNHVTPEEKEKVRDASVLGSYSNHPGNTVNLFSLMISTYFALQVYRERNVYVKEWKKRKRLVMNTQLTKNKHQGLATITWQYSANNLIIRLSRQVHFSENIK